MADKLSNDERVLLRNFLNDHFNIQELNTLLFELGVNPEEMESTPKSTFLLSIIGYFDRREHIDKLMSQALTKFGDTEAAPALRAILARLDPSAKQPAPKTAPEPAGQNPGLEPSATPALSSKKRFSVALSFPGEHRPYVKQIADALAARLSKDRVFYDRYYEAELSRPNLDTYLQKIYHDDADLVVVMLCEAYDEKEWCGLEFRAIRDLIKKRKDNEIMFVRVANGDVRGVFGIDGYVDAKNRPAPEVANLILERLAINAKNPN